MQNNPATQGAKNLGQWLAAVMNMKGESDQMSVEDAVAMIHATARVKLLWVCPVYSGRQGGSGGQRTGCRSEASRLPLGPRCTPQKASSCRHETLWRPQNNSIPDCLFYKIVAL